jgi:Uma2 family endonuclease
VKGKTKRRKEKVMALEHEPVLMTVEEYLALEEDDPVNCYEYVDGYVYMMAGGSLDHSAISLNLCIILKSLLRGSSCRVYNSDIKVRVSQKRYYHPDITVTCDPLDRGKKDTVQSPCIVFEVLSPSTEMTDRTRKLNDYLSHPTIEEYILVNSYSPKMELYRKEQGKWVYSVSNALDEIELACIGRHFAVIDAYEGVEVVEEADDENGNDGEADFS